MADSIPTKRCSKCKKRFPLTAEYFHRDSTSKSGFVSSCKTCVKERQAKHSDAMRLRALEWNKQNQVRYKHTQKNYRAKNQEKESLRLRDYRQTHPAIVISHTHKHRARKLQAGGVFNAQDIDEIYLDQNERCAYCGISLYHQYEIDHVLPLSRGGSNFPYNLALACEHCNTSKKDKLLSEWMMLRGW